MEKDRIDVKDGLILMVTYHIFDFLRQISIFQQIRNISRWRFVRRFHRQNPDSGKEELDKAWNESRPFVSSYLFPELWVIGNILFGICGCIVLSHTSSLWLGWVFSIYAMLRTFELFVYQINVLLFDPIKSGRASYRIKSATRMVILLICNIFEYALWFSILYMFVYISSGNEVPGGRVMLESLMTLTNITEPGEYVNPVVISIAYVEAIIGIFLNIVCLARFISLLPPVQTVDDN